MPSREDERWRNINPHPAACTCGECTRRRLASVGKELQICPSCGKKSLYYNTDSGLLECLNKKCYRQFSRDEVAESKTKKPVVRKKDAATNRTVRRGNSKIPTWVIALLFVFGLSVAGLGVSLFVGFFIPLWILFGFSLIFSVEKWFFYQARRHKSVGKLYRLFLNLTILTMLGLLIWSGIKLFSQQFAHSSLAGSLVFLGELVFFIWMWKVVSKNSWQWPSMKLTVFSLLAVTIVFAFAGVQPMSSYKDNLVGKIVDLKAQLATTQAERAAKIEAAKEKERIEEQRRVAEAIAMIPATITEALPKSPSSTVTLQDMDIRKAEESAFALINMYREERGAPPTVWDNKLYKLSKAHTQEMVRRGEIFHSSGDEVGENVWGGKGYHRYNSDDLAMVIVSSWITSPLHNAWLLHAPLKESVVSILITPDGQYASWSFWMNRLNSGPELVQKVAAEWKASGSNLDWISWLKLKGYLK